MFRIGEFAQVAQVSTRQLRFYDQIGILQPAHTDAQTGYRYYSIRQLPRLNRILALKELGLTLEQIAPLLTDGITTEQIRGMLLLQRAQVERTLHAEQRRLRYIESRIALLDVNGTAEGFDVMMKSVSAVPWLSVQYSCTTIDDAVRMVSAVATGGEQRIHASLRDKFVVVARNEDTGSERFVLEIGYSLTKPASASVQLAADLILRAGELPAVEAMATLIRQGSNETSHTAFGALGMWIAANNFAIAGPCREVFLERISAVSGFETALVEIQFPVRSMSG